MERTSIYLRGLVHKVVKLLLLLLARVCFPEENLLTIRSEVAKDMDVSLPTIYRIVSEENGQW